MSEDFVPPAARALLEHIRAKYGTIPKFAEANGFDRMKVADACNGRIQRLDVDFVLDVEDATGIPAEGWRTPPEVREARKRRRGEAHRIKPTATGKDAA